MFYHIITYGCQMNESDSERIASVLESMGYEPASNKTKADLIVINVCSVRQRAVDRVLGQCQKLVKLKTSNHELKTILTGCVLEEDRKKFQNKVDLIFGIEDLTQLPKLLKSKFFTPTQRYVGVNTNYLKIKPYYQSTSSAYVPVMTGCNNFCSYCVVPYVRGREYSRPAKEIIGKVKNLIIKGYKEITLLGQNVNSYRGNLKSQISKVKTTTQKSNLKVIDFPKLLKMVNDIEGNFWLRFVTSHPKDMSDRLIDAVANYKKVCEYVHLPIQSGDDKILEKMNRGYTIKEYLRLVEKIRAKISNVAISTDVIVGFPGETKKQFQNTIKLFKKVGFDMAYIAQYSPRAGTAAAKLKDDVPAKEKKRRKKILNEVLKKTALENNKKYIGQTVKILVESNQPQYQSKARYGAQRGKIRSFKNVKFESDKNLIGKFIKVKITEATPWGLKGELIKKGRN